MMGWSCMAEAVAPATGQDCHVYHSRGKRGRERQHQLTGLGAGAAWLVPLKEASDRRVKTIVYTSVPCVPGTAENMATELGISNGSPETLIYTRRSKTAVMPYSTSELHSKPLPTRSISASQKAYSSARS
ncbi:hypothetical protein B0H10DRAFT_2032000 [Mycena sp. CBHHK59/15]|nr:hypothetical protein B0H10DRAFT_2032000 [Mycena sp. CBHHK59/15]